MKRVIAYFVLAGMLGTGAFAQPEARSPQEDGPQLTSQDADKAKLQFAAATHDLILTFLAEGDYQAVLPEFRKILALDLENGFEDRLTQGAWQIVEELRAQGRYDLAHQIIGETLEQVDDIDNRFDLLILQGKTFKDQGRYQDAILSLQKARQLRPQSEDSQNKDPR
ncbi:MAG TPA: hypothetical protein VLV83_21480 [Acidobacteriota bacterium]|nr:hypothetical protein [Acidobacteriota bacterium]